jgi:hypothetical protein
MQPPHACMGAPRRCRSPVPLPQTAHSVYLAPTTALLHFPIPLSSRPFPCRAPARRDSPSSCSRPAWLLLAAAAAASRGSAAMAPSPLSSPLGATTQRSSALVVCVSVSSTHPCTEHRPRCRVIVLRRVRRRRVALLEFTSAFAFSPSS